ncbi:type II secretion system F family protein [Candidatus Aerophobetes bacterium]|uniref:Type II secretion system F family protein n=1 Tax=Aerophobetes bacterium TaxID=2030807 RepID=A0A523V1L7_UNCAE|nr:MAG: type II secretion system F family protein [Candidatus Aerophobetes bacterium]
MAAYYYLARTRQGERVKGTVEAENEAAAASQLRPRGLVVISIKKSGFFTFVRQASLTWLKILQPRVKSKDVIVFTRQFATLISTGIPIVQALGILIEQTTNTTLKDILNEVRKDVEAGMALSAALSKHPKIFPPLFTNMIKAGEMGGILEAILTRLAGYLEYADTIKQRMKTALRYPIFVMFMAGGLTMAALLFILPEMKVLFADAFQAELPALTQFMLDLSDFAGDKLYLVILIVVLLAIGYYLIKRSPRGGYFLDKLKLKIPILGKLFHKVALSRFSRTLAILSDSGVPILDALDMTGKAAENMTVQKATEEAQNSLRDGHTIADPLRKSPVFPPMVVNMIAIGEETGALDKMLNKVADFYDQEVEAIVNSLASLIEPLLILFLGATVGIIAVAMYLPYFSMFEYIGK